MEVGRRGEKERRGLGERERIEKVRGRRDRGRR